MLANVMKLMELCVTGMMGTMTMSIHKIQKTIFLLKKLSMGILTSKLSLRPMKSTHAHSSQFSLS